MQCIIYRLQHYALITYYPSLRPPEGGTPNYRSPQVDIVEIVDKVREMGIIPVVAIPRLEHALPLAENLLEGGLPCAEVTFRTAAAAESITEIRARFPEIAGQKTKIAN